MTSACLCLNLAEFMTVIYVISHDPVPDCLWLCLCLWLWFDGQSIILKSNILFVAFAVLPI